MATSRMAAAAGAGVAARPLLTCGVNKSSGGSLPNQVNRPIISPSLGPCLCGCHLYTLRSNCPISGNKVLKTTLLSLHLPLSAKEHLVEGTEERLVTLSLGALLGRVPGTRQHSRPRGSIPPFFAWTGHLSWAGPGPCPQLHSHPQPLTVPPPARPRSHPRDTGSSQVQ